MMKKWAKAIADDIKSMQPDKNNTNLFTAKIESVTPFKANIGNGTFILTEKNTKSVIESHFIGNLSGNFSIDSISGQGSYQGEISLKDRLKIGDLVLVMTGKDGQDFYLIGKVAEL